MRLTLWGTRGSISVSGPQYVKYGGDTTCAELETRDGEVVVLDAGTGVRALGNRLVAEGRKVIHFLFTHAHWDHLLGFPFFKPLYRKDVTVHVHGCTYAQQSVRTILEETMRAPFFPVDLSGVAAKLVFSDETPESFSFAGLVCRSVPISHPNNGYGFLLSEGSRTVAFFPDNELCCRHPGGLAAEEYTKILSGVSVLIHDGEFTPDEHERFSRGWGHSVYLNTVRLALDARVGRLLIWHNNQDRTDDAADEMCVRACGAVKEAGRKFPCEIARAGTVIDV